MYKYPEKWNEDFLKSMSLKKDPLADNVINDIVLGNDFNDLRHLFMTLTDNNDKSSGSEMNPSVYNYFNQNNELPLWADQSKIELAQSVYYRHGPQISMILNFYALPLCYSCKNGAKVLAATGRLSGTNKDVGRTFRRLFETSKIVLDTMTEGGLSDKGAGIVTAKKVRLYHAAIRYFLLHEKCNPAGWDVETLGEPINQEEMAGTLMSFSALVIDGLEQLGAKLTTKEKDSYIHLWNIVGHFMGVDASLFPSNYKEGWSLGVSIINRNYHSSEDSIVLTKSLLDFSENIFQKTKMHHLVLKTMPFYLIQFFSLKVSKEINQNIPALLGVNKKLNFFQKFKGGVFIFIIQLLSKLENKSKFFRKIYARITQKYLKKMIQFYLETYNADFYIPSSLKASWKMKG
ncbi:MAG: DUF2236 domain-containing protein [Fluviicola sp.]|jgi:hypothetical protein|nr:DUF2236 domain-containing protein [Fluviicola sp.]